MSDTPTQTELVTFVLDSLNEFLAQTETNLAEPVSEATYLIGRHSVLDSLGLVTLIVDLEQRLEERYDIVLTLANERAMSQKNSPFLTVGSLAGYIHTLILEEQGIQER